MLQEKITNWMNWAGGMPINGWQWQIDGCGLGNAIRLCFFILVFIEQQICISIGGSVFHLE